MGQSTVSVPATRTEVTTEESQVSQIGSVVRMEEEECEISLVSDTVTQDTEISEPPLLIKRITLYELRILILIWRIQNNFFVDL